jgi:hypothetical protein
MNDRPTPAQEAQRLYEEAETQTARAMERIVGSDSFGELLARMTENVLALTRIGNETMDLVVRNLRVAGRQDIARLGRQIARTEDKLETVLQEVERLQDEVRESASRNGGPAQAKSASADKRS